MSIAPAEAPTAVLNHSNRCDSCGSRAYVLVGLVTGELQFCRHHWLAVEKAITPHITMLIDEQWQLTEHIRDTGHIS